MSCECVFRSITLSQEHYKDGFLKSKNEIMGA